MAGYSFYLYDKDSKNDTPIFLSITYGGERVKLKTKQKVKPKAWNAKSKSIRKNWTEYDEVQKELDRILKVVKDSVERLKDQHQSLPPRGDLKKILEADVFTDDIINTDVTFWRYYEAFIGQLKHRKNPRTGNPISKATIEQYKQTYDTLKRFETDTGKVISFMLLSNKLYDEIVMYLESLDFAPNTVGKHIKHIKSVINRAKDTDGITVSENYKDKYWQVSKQVRTAEEIVILNDDELNALGELDLSKNSMQEKSRDVFLVGAYTGLRISDIVKLKTEHIDSDGFIRKHNQKTDKSVTIPVLRKEVIEILKKYDDKMPRISEQRVNENIKIICKKLKSMRKKVTIKQIKGNKMNNIEFSRYEKVTTHTGRRSFASNLYKKGISTQMIMAITGHKKEADFNRYIGITNEDLAKGLMDKYKDLFD